MTFDALQGKFPTLAVDDSANHGTAYTESIGYALLGMANSGQLTNSDDVGLGKHCSVTFAVGMTALGEHVMRVIFLSAEKQMQRIAARRIVALMAYTKSFWDRAISNLPRQDMRVYLAFAAPATPDLAVPSFMAPTSPWPAFIGVFLKNLRPEANFDWNELFHGHGVAWRH